MFNHILKLKDPCYNCDALPKYLKFTNCYQAIELFNAQNAGLTRLGCVTHNVTISKVWLNPKSFNFSKLCYPKTFWSTFAFHFNNL